MKRVVWTFVIAITCGKMYSMQPQRAPHIISFFLRPYIGPNTQTTPRSPIHQGIIVNYAGLVTFSNNDGQVTIPLKHSKEHVKVLVTPSIKPVLLQANTVHHFEISPHVPAAYYLFERIKDQKLNTYVWKVTKEKLPNHNKIPAAAVVIMADPKEILIFEGIFPTEKSPNFILPDMYIEPTITLKTTGLHFIKSNQFFAPLKPLIKYDNNQYTSII